MDSTLAIPQSRARLARWALPALAGALVVWGLFLTRAAEQTRDSLVYALAAKTGVEVFHPHHLIYTPAIRLLYKALQPLCPTCDAVLAGQIHNILWAAVGLLALFALLKRVWNWQVALAATALFLALRGVWELATQTTMYVPGAAVLTLLSAVLVTGRPRAMLLSPARTALLAGLLALAVLYHQANVLFVLPLGLYLLAAGGKAGGRGWAVVVGLAGLVVLTAYWLVYLASGAEASLAGFIDYCLAYTSEICLGGLCKASPAGWGSLANLSPDGLKLALGSLAWNLVVVPAQLETPAAAALGLGLLALAGWHLRQLVRRAPDGPLRLFALSWLAVTFVFFWWWLPDYQHPFVVALAPLTILGIVALCDLTARPANDRAVERLAVGVIACAALLVGGRNYQVRILPLHQSPGDAYWEAAALSAAAPPECVFLTSYRTWNHLRYYFDRLSAVQARHPLSFFALGERPPAQYDLSGRSCVFVSTTFLLPTYMEDDYSDDPVDAYQNPERWLAYLTWLLDVRPAGPAPALASRDFSVVRFEEGDPYLRLWPTRRTVDGWVVLLSQLDAALEAPTQPFLTWYSQVR
ncbi:MAG TPA: hypothetical protein VFF68_08075 [Anaerolineaceae bacterium]|nr:hypothetical protein [Anaerolineaceae bacterium]